MLTMLLGGLWHGAGWTFVVWGGIHGIGLALERWWQRSPRCVAARRDDAARAGVARLVTFHVVCLAWVFFRADSFGGAWDMLDGALHRLGRRRRRSSRAASCSRSRSGSARSTFRARVPRAIMARFSRLPVARPGRRARRSR